ncbi:MAG: carboxypeptidase-like regulatory domain-containing protein [Cyclobacteriaceae bacterium]|nr:carboxypeptidase-like regulatory domain-containing protein [Cyclobacteriaceae bacterium]
MDVRFGKIQRAFFILIYCLCHLQAFGQQISIRGQVRDEMSSQSLQGVTILIENTLEGTVTSADGTFELKTQRPLPFRLVFTSIGYVKKIVEVKEPGQVLMISLSEDEILLGQDVVVSASRVEERLLTAPISLEKLSAAEIRNMSAANFYDGLYILKGVDMSAHGLIFRFPNARGFNGNNNFRFNQFIDGVDNMPPALNFAAGNIFGIPEIDVAGVEMLVGASSALYGPGGMNGTLLIQSKNPFEYQGLSLSLQSGLMHVGAPYRDSPGPMYDLNMRYAKSFRDKVAFKVTAGYLRATDWHAFDYRDRTDLDNAGLNRRTNPGYDGVNTYGDEVVIPVNLRDFIPEVTAAVAASEGIEAGTAEYEELFQRIDGFMPDQIVTRTGWREQDMTNYNTDNLRLNTALHYKVTPEIEAIGQLSFGMGKSIYTAQSRFAIEDFYIGSARLELKSPDFYIRAYGITENAGNTHDLGLTALLINETWKPSLAWYTDYLGAFAQSRLLGGNERDAHGFARLIADNRDENGNIFNPLLPAQPLAGSPEFNTLRDELISRPISQGGTRVVDQSKLWHVEGMYNFSQLIPWAEILVGASHRVFIIDSQGTIFADTPGNPITIQQSGAFAQISKGLWGERLKLSGSARYDKNEYFRGKFTPRFSGVFQLDKNQNHFLRASYQTAFRFPAVSDQWLDIFTGRFQVVGGLPQVQRKYNFDTVPLYPLSGSNPITDVPVTENGPFEIPEFGPEKVTATEIGYRGLFLNNALMIDASIYQNVYNGFLALQNLVQFPGEPNEMRFQTTISTDDPLTAYGWSFGADMLLPGKFLLRTNVNYNALQSLADRPPGFESRFNTPDYRFNVSLGNPGVYKNIGFNLSYRWQNAFLWESNFGVADMPAFGMLDGHIMYRYEKWHSHFKLGGSNLFNNFYITNFGSASIGGLYYVSWAFDNPLSR